MKIEKTVETRVSGYTLHLNVKEASILRTVANWAAKIARVLAEYTKLHSESEMHDLLADIWKELGDADKTS
jgi:hypothetical protein